MSADVIYPACYHARASAGLRARSKRDSSKSRAARPAKSPSVIPDLPRSAAKATTPAQCPAGIPLVFQPLTVESDCSSAPATSPRAPGAGPLKLVMTESHVSMDANIVRAMRTRQEFATCETTFICGHAQIEDMEPDSDEAVGRRIVALRAKAMLQQQELAADLNITKSTLSAYESGDRPLTMESARRLRRRFGVSIDWILFGDMQLAGRDMMFAIGPEPAAVQGKKVRTLRK